MVDENLFTLIIGISSLSSLLAASSSPSWSLSLPLQSSSFSFSYPASESASEPNYKTNKCLIFIFLLFIASVLQSLQYSTELYIVQNPLPLPRFCGDPAIYTHRNLLNFYPSEHERWPPHGRTLMSGGGLIRLIPNGGNIKFMFFCVFYYELA